MSCPCLMCNPSPEDRARFDAMIQPNVALIRKEIEWAQAHPDEWDQEVWAIENDDSPCGTACCIAGHTVMDAGIKLKWNRDSVSASETADGRFIPTVARELLGLTVGQADRLFEAGNRILDLWEIANDITNGEVEIPVEFQ